MRIEKLQVLEHDKALHCNLWLNCEVTYYMLCSSSLVGFICLPLCGGKILEQRSYVEEPSDCNNNRKAGENRQAQKEEKRPNFNPVHLNHS